MKGSENFVLQGVKLAVDNLTLELMRQREEAAQKTAYGDLPEWVTLEQAARLKGGAALNTYRARPALQPCCGLRYKKIGGRRCWRREDVIEWITVSDDELEKYKQKARMGAS